MSLKHAVLGFLELQPMSGYDLNKAFKESAGHFWSADQSHIYRTLADLESQELVNSTLVPQDGKPDRREYSITGQGKKELDAWLASPMPMDTMRESFLVRLFFAARLGAEGVLSLIAERIDATQHAIDILEEVQCGTTEFSKENKDDLGIQMRLQTLTYGLVHYNAEMQWLQDLKVQATRIGKVGK